MTKQKKRGILTNDLSGRYRKIDIVESFLCKNSGFKLQRNRSETDHFTV